MKSWFKIKNEASEKAEIFIYDEIGYWGITSIEFAHEFSKIEASEIDLRIDCIGGSVHMGMAIYSIIKNSNKKINVFIDGIAASMGSVIALAGDTISMPNNALFMVHKPSSFVIGNSIDFDKESALLNKIQNQIAQLYADKTGKTIDEMNALMDAETWLTGSEAKDIGFVDSTTEELKAVALYDFKECKYKNLDKYNNLIKNIKQEPRSVITVPQPKHKKEGSVEPKTIDELKVKFPELAKTIENTASKDAFAKGRESERERLAGIDSLSSKGTEEIIAKAKADPEADKGSTALLILEAQKVAGEKAIVDLEKDGKDLAGNVSEIGAPANLGTDQTAQEIAESEKEAKEIADLINEDRK